MVGVADHPNNESRRLDSVEQTVQELQFEGAEFGPGRHRRIVGRVRWGAGSLGAIAGWRPQYAVVELGTLLDRLSEDLHLAGVRPRHPRTNEDIVDDLGLRRRGVDAFGELP